MANVILNEKPSKSVYYINVEIPGISATSHIMNKFDHIIQYELKNNETTTSSTDNVLCQHILDNFKDKSIVSFSGDPMISYSTIKAFSHLHKNLKIVYLTSIVHLEDLTESSNKIKSLLTTTFDNKIIIPEQIILIGLNDNLASPI